MRLGISKFVFLLAITASLCQEEPLPSNELSQFLTGFFGYFNISDIDPALSCFSEFDSYLFLYWVQKIQDFSIAVSQGNTQMYSLSQLLVLQSSKDLETNFVCFTNTSAYNDLVETLNMSNHTSEVKSQLSYYFQSFIPEWVDATQEAYNELNKENFLLSGKYYASSFKTLIQNVTERNTYGLLRAFYNGIFLMQNLTTPSDSIYCYNSSTALPLLQFYQNMSSYVRENTKLVTNTYNVIGNFFTTQGKQIHTQISSNVLNCIKNSTDNKRFSKKMNFGLDPLDPKFIQASLSLSISNPKMLFYYLKESEYYAKQEMTLTKNIDFGVSIGAFINYEVIE